ncbi:MAG: DEAD/DEAH box helicase [Deltaproteobacteria bacterium]|nr:DEAD/DEAH box helicase [Deltaproteobacteria bacterium]MBK8717459.1 DEAD/DEAH box helicase [Deltaproteobacteria bacterium]
MTFDDFFRKATSRDPYAYQRAFAAAESLPDLLEAPTGSGKTATAVLGWLWRRLHGSPTQRDEAGTRLVFCLPMRTLVEQTHRAVIEWVRRLNLGPERLGVHLMLGGAVDDGWEQHPDRDTIIIGTQDQLLSRALMRGYAMSRYRWPVHFALLNNDCTWVIDEVQLMGVGASTASQLQAFREQLGVAGSAKTVWMTATLAEGRLRTVDVRRALSRQPFVAAEPALERRLRARKTLERAATPLGKKGSLAPLAKEIAAAHVPGTLTLVVVNRVQRAQELYALLGHEPGLEATALVHSRFRPIDRRRIQDAALAGTFVGVLVATQAIEAGVDISAKTLFTELAPWASLVQRFGRLNRAGEHESARAVLIDIETEDANLCLPYEADALVAARTKANALTDVGPASLATIATEAESPTLPVLRGKDLIELFDTEPDLAGHDIDVAPYVRATDDRDVQVAWRELGDEPPGLDAPDLQRDELCQVPVHELEKLTKGKSVWRFDGLRRAWVEVERLFPGLAVVVDVGVGGYRPDAGFTRDRADVPPAVAARGEPPDADAADSLTFGGDYITMRTHAEDTAVHMRALLDRLGRHTAAIVDEPVLIDAARWHDAGKVHPAFQQMLIEHLPGDDPRRTGGPWAKSDGRHGGRNPRRFFRHELASALAWLAAGKSDLGAFVVAAHHGKVRIALRARPGEEPPTDRPHCRFAHGVHDGDTLPSVDLGDGEIVPEQALSLACMELGGGEGHEAWSDQMMRLLERHGPFRLSYVETLVRVADWRASQQRDRHQGGPDAG